jgi:hypothetical protein
MKSAVEGCQQRNRKLSRCQQRASLFLRACMRAHAGPLRRGASDDLSGGHTSSELFGTEWRTFSSAYVIVDTYDVAKTKAMAFQERRI